MKALHENQNTQTVDEADNSSMLGHLRASIAATIVLVILCCGVYPLMVWALAQGILPGRANGSLLTKAGAVTSAEDQAIGSAILGQNFSAPAYFHPRPSAAGAGYDAANSGGSNLGPLSDKLINGVVTPATTEPTAVPAALAYDGVRLRTIRYAVENSIPFKLYNVRSDNPADKVEVPLAKFTDAQGNLNDVALVEAFPHAGDAPERVTLVARDFSQLIPGDAVTTSGSGLDPHISPPNARIQAARVASARRISVDQVQRLLDEHTDQRSLGVFGDPGVNVLMVNLALDAKHPVPATQPAVK